MVVGCFSGKKSEATYGSKCAFIYPTRIGIVDELFIKIWRQNSTNSMMDKPIPYTCLVNIAWFRIVDFKRVIWSVLVVFICQFLMKLQDVVHEV